MTRVAVALAICTVLWTSAALSQVQSYPVKPVRMLPADAQQRYPTRPIRLLTAEVGGGADFAARLIAQGLSTNLGERVIVDNRGIISAEIAARANPDGHTLLLYGSPLWLSPLIREVPYDPVLDFSPITVVLTAPNIVVVHPSVPVKSVSAPGLPTVAASGVPGYESQSPFGVFAPAKTPPAIIARLNQELVRFLKQSDTKERFFNTGVEAVGSSAEELAQMVKSEMAKWGRLVKQAGIRE